MGTAHGKDVIITTTSTPTKQHTIADYISPLHKTIASSYEDPRSPGGRRTPLHSPNATPTLSSKYHRERMLMRVGSTSKFGALDPRSPATNRTPLSGTVATNSTPPPFSLGDSRTINNCDPRSPYSMRTPLSMSVQTPLSLSTQDAIVSDIIVVGEEIVMSTPLDVSLDGADAKDHGNATADTPLRISKASTDTFSPEISSLVSIAVSPLYDSGSIARMRRRDLARVSSLSPLKKSYSAPLDENSPNLTTSPVCKAVPTLQKTARAPLSPLTQRAVNSRHCVGVQPIKFRMDPGILG